MDRFFDRLSDIIRGFLDEDDTSLFGNSAASKFRDPDLDAAYDELNDYLRKDSSGTSKDSSNTTGSEHFRSTTFHTEKNVSRVPEELRKDFNELGVSFGASREQCKAAYKKLLKIHHPDRHAGHEGNMKRATEKSARINTAYKRIEAWREKGSLN